MALAFNPNLEKTTTVKGMKDPNSVTKVDPYGKTVSDGKISTGAVGTPEGAYNPRTSGYESANANVGVNTGDYSIANKAKMAQDYGYTDMSKVSQDAFFRNADGSMGFKMPKLTPAKPVAPAVTTPGSTGTPPAGTTPPAPTTPTAPAAGGLPAPTNVPLTGIPEVDAANAKAAKERDDDRKATENAYISGKASFEKNAGYYTNFDATNKAFTGVMDERRAALATSPNGDLTDAQAQAIATKYGVTVDAVKDPNKVWDALKLTKEGENKLGVTDWQSGMDTMKTDYERKQADIATNLKNTSQQYQNQIDDVSRQLERNVNFMTASGAWSGASKSSGYLTGIQNVKDDGNRVIERIEALRTQLETASSEDAARLTEDFGKAVSAAKKKFDDELTTMRIDAGTQLSGIAEQYGTGSDKLKTALQAIEDSFHTKTLESMRSYIEGVRSINQITNDNVELAMKQSQYRDSQANAAYDDYVKDNGAALANATYSSIVSQVKSGTLSAPRAEMLKSAMLSSIVNTLQKNGSAVNAAEQSTIDTLLKHGATPAQVVAQMRNMDKFAMSDAPKIEKIGDKSYVFNPNTSSYEELKESADTIDPSSVALGEGNKVQFTPEADKTLRSAGINTSLLSLADGTVRTGRKNAEQCGAYTNDVMGVPGLMGDDLEDKPVNSQVPEIGSAIVMDFKDAKGNSVNTNGHVGIVVGINGSVLTIKSSNAHSDERKGTITTDELDLSDPKNVEVKGFYVKDGVSGAGNEKKAVTETDMNRLLNNIDKGPKSEDDRKNARAVLEEHGGDFNKALFAYLGFNVNDSDLAAKAVSSLKDIGLSIKDVNGDALAANLNSGNLKAAASNIEKAAYNSDTGKSLKLAEKDSDYRNLYKNYSQLKEKLEANKDKIGVVAGRWADVKRKLGGDAELQGLASQLTAVFAKLRKNFAGAAVTETEMKALSDYINGSTKEPLENILAKLDNIMTTTDNEYQSDRATAGLPQLGDASQIDDRSTIYFGGGKASDQPNPAGI